jgi:hypothetical protein
VQVSNDLRFPLQSLEVFSVWVGVMSITECLELVFIIVVPWLALGGLILWSAFIK